MIGVPPPEGIDTKRITSLAKKIILALIATPELEPNRWHHV